MLEKIAVQPNPNPDWNFNLPFTLQYRGHLLSTNRHSTKENKHQLRSYFHPQLKMLASDPPMDLFHYSVGGELFPVGEFKFKAIVSKKIAACALDIKLLTRSKPGILTPDGDLDNRLKTILDSLQVPKKSELPDSVKPPDQPFYVLLENDSSVVGLKIEWGRLFLPPFDNEPSAYAEVNVKVKIMGLNQV